MSRQKVLIIEENPEISEYVRFILESEGYSLEKAEDGNTGMEKISEDLDLVILDITMPDMNGVKICENIRKISMVPILFITPESPDPDGVFGLMAGGDGFLRQPFSYADLLGTVKALIRRYIVYRGKNEQEPENGYIEIGNIKINKDYNEVYVNGQSVVLTNLEYSILHLLMSHPGRAFSLQNLYERVWNEPYFYSCNNTIMVHIRKLRLKVENNPKKPEHIINEWGNGYKFEAGTQTVKLQRQCSLNQSTV